MDQKTKFILSKEMGDSLYSFEEYAFTVTTNKRKSKRKSKIGGKKRKTKRKSKRKTKRTSSCRS
jgi:hypothetical protein